MFCGFVDDLLIIHNGLKFNTERSFFGQTQMEYLSFLVTQNGIRPENKKVEPILNMTPPNSIRQVRAFVVLVKYY